MAVHNRPLNYKFMKLGRSVVLCVRMSVALSWIINYLLCTALSRIIPRTKNAIIRPTQTTTIIAVMLPGKKRAKIYVKTPKIMKKNAKERNHGWCCLESKEPNLCENRQKLWKTQKNAIMTVILPKKKRTKSYVKMPKVM